MSAHVHDNDIHAPIHHGRARFAAGTALMAVLFLIALALTFANLRALHG